MLRRSTFQCLQLTAVIDGNDMLPTTLAAPPTNDSEFPYEAPEEYLNYVANRYDDNQRPILYPPKKEKIEKMIDAIPPALVACANIEKLRAAHEGNGLATFKAVQRGFDLLNGRDYVDPTLLVTPAEAEYLREKRGLGCLPKPVTPIVAVGLTHLATKSKLGMKFSYAQVAHPNFGNGIPQGQRSPTSEAGAFFVAKSNKLFRPITDGRPAHLPFQQNYGTFNFFTLDVLKSVIGNLQNSNKKWYAVNLDLRHWFHQIPLPSQYWNYLGTHLPFYNKKAKEYQNYWLFPRALPMGWLLAPYIAQCLTWSLVLSSATGVFPAENFGVPRRGLGGFESPPAWIPLIGGGGIFVLLDNILIVTPNKDLAEKWFEKMVGDCAAFNVVLKGTDEIPGSTPQSNFH